MQWQNMRSEGKRAAAQTKTLGSSFLYVRMEELRALNKSQLSSEEYRNREDELAGKECHGRPSGQGDHTQTF